MVANPARGQLNRKIVFSLSSFTPEILFSRDRFGGPVSRQRLLSTLRLNLVPTPGIPPDFGDGVYKYRQPPSSQYQIHGFTQLGTDGVHYREPTTTGLPISLSMAIFHPSLAKKA